MLQEADWCRAAGWHCEVLKGRARGMAGGQRGWWRAEAEASVRDCAW